MNFSRLFVDRPIFASVLSIIIFVQGVKHAVALVGFNPVQGANTPNVGTVFILFEDFEVRERTAQAISDDLNAQLER